MKAMILAAGYGKRLNPLTLKNPKPLLKLNDLTLLENTINLIKKLGISDIKLNTFYLKDQIKIFIEKKNFDVKIEIHKDAKKKLKDRIPIAAVSTGFPAGLSSFQTRKQEIIDSINNGADEVDIVINRGFVLQNDWKRLYDEIQTFKLAAKKKRIKAIFWPIQI